MGSKYHGIMNWTPSTLPPSSALADGLHPHWAQEASMGEWSIGRPCLYWFHTETGPWGLLIISLTETWYFCLKWHAWVLLILIYLIQFCAQKNEFYKLCMKMLMSLQSTNKSRRAYLFKLWFKTLIFFFYAHGYYFCSCKSYHIGIF